jgi:hypothetical protein
MNNIYFSHSYKPRDAEINEFFGLLLERSDLVPTADPPSEKVNAAKLERHLRSNDGMVSILTQRDGGWSQYMHYEMNLCIRSRKPLLVFVEDTLPDDLIPSRILQRRFSRGSVPRQARAHNHAVQIFQGYLGGEPEYQPSIRKKSCIVAGFAGASRVVRRIVIDELEERQYALIDIGEFRQGSLQDPMLTESIATASLAVCNVDASRALAQYVIGALQSSIVPSVVLTMREDYPYRKAMPRDLQPLFVDPSDVGAVRLAVREQMELFEQDFLALTKPELVEAYTKALKSVPSESGKRESHVRDVFVNVIEEVVMGDKTDIGGDVIGSAVGRGAKVEARDITVYKQAVDGSPNLADDAKEKLKQAREAIEKVDLSEDDRTDILDDLGKLTAELEKPEKDPSRLKRFLGRIKEISAPTAEIIMSAASIAKFIGL